jgi:hypothetical protein
LCASTRPTFAADQRSRSFASLSSCCTSRATKYVQMTLGAVLILKPDVRWVSLSFARR